MAWCLRQEMMRMHQQVSDSTQTFFDDLHESNGFCLIIPQVLRGQPDLHAMVPARPEKSRRRRSKKHSEAIHQRRLDAAA